MSSREYRLDTLSISQPSGSPFTAAEAADKTLYYRLEKSSAVLEFDVSEGMYVFCDAGNYTGHGVCTLTLDCIGADGASLFSYGSVTLPSDGYFYRASIGNGAMYAGLAEGTEKVRLTIECAAAGTADSPYFRALSVYTDDTTARDMSVSGWELSERMLHLDLGTSLSDRLILIGFVCAVAGIMMIVAKARNKYRKGK